jgi:hypothetical protein
VNLLRLTLPKIIFPSSDGAKSFLNTLGNLKQCRDAMKKDATNVERVEEQRHVLENELQNLRWKLSESGAAKIWSELLTREKFEAKKVSLELTRSMSLETD